MIFENAEKHSNSAMCKALKIARSTLYHKCKPKAVDTALENAVIREFRASRGNYGTPKLKIMLNRRNIRVSRRRIGKIMKKHSLISKWTLRRAKTKASSVNNDETANVEPCV